MATAVPDKLRQEKSFVQIEGKLTEAQLEAIASTTVNSQQSTINHQPSTINKS